MSHHDVRVEQICYPSFFLPPLPSILSRTGTARYRDNPSRIGLLSGQKLSGPETTRQAGCMLTVSVRGSIRNIYGGPGGEMR